MIRRNLLLFISFLLLAVALILAAAVPSWREKLRDRFTQENHEVLATAEGDLLNDGSMTKVVKYRGSEGIYVEIVKMDSSPNGQFIDRILLADKRDGLFNFQGHITRLAIADVDHQGKNELLAPTFDTQLVPHLNVFRYNPALGRFEPYSAASQGK